MATPTRLGRYELIEHIATGGMAELYLARPVGGEGPERRVVLKRIVPARARDPHLVRLLVREAHIGANVVHPNVVSIHGLDRSGDHHFIVMEYVAGRDLAQVNRELRRRERHWPPGLALWVVGNVLRGLGHAHAAVSQAGEPLGLVHGDVSPQNVLLGFQGEVKLVDFGVARLGEDPAEPAGGKPAYFAPEQRGGAAGDRRADIYAAGVVLWETLAGRRLAEAELCRPPRLCELRPELPPSLDQLLHRLLEPAPDARLASASEAEEALQELRRAQGWRGDPVQLGRLMRELFPEEAPRASGTVNLAALAADLRQIQPAPAPAPMAVPLRPANEASRPVVVMVVEVVGLTQVSAAGDAQSIVKAHLRLLRALQRIVERAGGRVARFEDDVAIVHFGLLRADEHDAERALQCAARLSRPLRGEAAAFRFSVGLHRGELIVADGPRGPRAQSRGPTMKLARRLCVEAEVGQVLLSDAFHRLVAPRVRSEPGPRFHLKGHPEEHGSWIFRGHRRAEAAVPARPWIPRRAELAALAEAIDGLARGSGRVVALVGPSGTGKSRLLRELGQLALHRGLGVHLGHVRPGGEEGPLSAFRDILFSMLGLEGHESAGQIHQRLGRLEAWGVGPRELRELIAVFGHEDPDQPLPVELLAVAATRVIRGIAAQRPLVLAIEDVEYLSPSACRLLPSLVAAIRESPVLAVLTAQGALPDELGQPDQLVELSPLDEEEVRALACERLGVRDLDRSLLELIRATAEGKPLYVEALVDHLLDQARISTQGGQAWLVDPQRPVELPPGLEALIQARLDALGPQEREVLQMAAALGSRFEAELLCEAVGPAADVVGLLRERGLLVHSAVEPEKWRFASAFMADVVRRSVLDHQRRGLHSRLLAALLRYDRDALEHRRPQLAHHAALAGELVLAAQHARVGGEQLLRRRLLREAARLWEQGLRWLEQARAEEPALEAALSVGLGSALCLLGEARRGEVHLRVALEALADGGPWEVEARAHLELARLGRARGRYAEVQAHLDQCFELLRGEGEGARRLHAEAAEQAALVAAVQGQLEEAGRLLEEAERCAVGEPAFRLRLALSRAHLELQAGQREAAEERLAAVVELARQTGDHLLLARALNQLGRMRLLEGDATQAEQQAEHALRLCEGSGHRLGQAAALLLRGQARLDLGELERAVLDFGEAERAAGQAAWLAGRALAQGFALCCDLLQEGHSAADRLEGVHRLEETGAVLGEMGQAEALLQVQGLQVRLLRAAGQAQEARAAARLAAELAARGGVGPQLVRWALGE